MWSIMSKDALQETPVIFMQSAVRRVCFTVCLFFQGSSIDIEVNTLKSLRDFKGPDCYGTSFKWELAEVEWAVRHWVNIRTLGQIKFDEAARKYWTERSIKIVKI